MDEATLKSEMNLFLMRTLIPLGIMAVTLVMLVQARYPHGIFWEISIPLYLVIQGMVFAGARRFGAALSLGRPTVTLVSGLAFVSAGIFPIAYLMSVWRGRPPPRPEPTPLDCRMPVVIDGRGAGRPEDGADGGEEVPPSE